MIDAKTAREITKSEEQLLQEKVEFWLERIELGIRRSASESVNNYRTDFGSEILMDRLQAEIEKLGFKVEREVYKSFIALKIEW